MFSTRHRRHVVMGLALVALISTAALTLSPSPSAAQVETYSSGNSSNTFTVPSGVSNVYIEVLGAAGGRGGNDGSQGGSTGPVGYVYGSVTVSGGQQIGVYVGGAGSAGSSSVTSTGGGSGGLNALSGYDGGSGGNTGGQGNSGAGGGGGAASVVVLPSSAHVVGAGAGGGGGSGNTTRNSTQDGYLNGFQPGSTTGSTTGGNGQSVGSADGGSGAGGGGGAAGGAGGGIFTVGAEYHGYGAASGTNNAQGLTSTYRTANNGATGQIKIAYARVPSFTALSASTGRTVGQNVTLSTGSPSSPDSGSLSYVWKKDGSVISGANSSSYSVANVTSSTAGTYTVEITNTISYTRIDGTSVSLTTTATSSTTLTVSAVPTISSSTLETATFGVAYSTTLSGTYPAGLKSWAMSGSTPPGLTLTTSGVLSGTPSAANSEVSYSFTVTLTDTNDYAVSTTVQIKVMRAQRTGTLTPATASAAYGQEVVVTPQFPTDSVTLVTYSTSSASQCTVNSSGVVTMVASSGSCDVSAQMAAGNNYTAGSASTTISLSKKSLTVTAVNKSKTAEGANPVFAVSAPDLEFSDAITSATFTFSSATYESSTTVPVNIGTYTITPSNAQGSGLENYTIVYSTGTLTVDPITTIVSGVGSATRAYGTGIYAIPASSNSSAAFSFSSSNTLVATVDSVGDVTLVKPGQTTIRITQNAQGNYTASDVSFVLTVTKGTQSAVLLSSTSSSIRVNDTATVTATGGTTSGSLTIAKVSGNCGFDSATGQVTGVSAGTTCEFEATRAGDDYWEPRTSQRYTISVAKALTSSSVSASASSVTYGSSITLTFGVTGNASPTGDVAVRAGSSTISTVQLTNGAASFAFSPTPAHVRAGSVSLSIAYQGDSNSETSTSSALAISVIPKPITISGVAVSHKQYDGTRSAQLTGMTPVGVVGQDSVSVASGTTIATFDSATVGSAIPVSVSGDLALAGADADLYSISAQPSFAGLSANITPAPLDIEPVPLTKVYGQLDPQFIARASASTPLFGSDAITSATFSRVTGEAVGDYVVTPLSASGAGLSNYTVTYKPGTFTITGKPLTIAAVPAQRHLQEVDPLWQFSVNGLLATDTVTAVTFTFLPPSGPETSTVPTAVGVYGLNVSAAQGAGLGNYDIEYETATYEITKVPHTFTVTGPNSVLSGSAPTQLEVGPSQSTGAFTFTSSNPLIATVSPTGLITWVAAGSVTITVTQAADDIFAEAVTTLAVSVRSPAPEVRPLPETVKIEGGALAGGPGVLTVAGLGRAAISVPNTVQRALTGRVEFIPQSDGSVKVEPARTFSGILDVPVEIRNGGVIYTSTTRITVLPLIPAKPVLQVLNTDASKIVWTKSPNAIGYRVEINGKTTLLPSDATSIVSDQLLGPKAKVRIISLGGDGTESVQVVPIYAPAKPITLSFASFIPRTTTIPSSSRDVISQFAAKVKQAGFTRIAVTGYAEVNGVVTSRSPLAKARARALVLQLRKNLPGIKVVVVSGRDSRAQGPTPANWRVDLAVW